MRSIHDSLHKDDTSKAVKFLFRWYQSAAGISHPILEIPNHSTEYVNSKWTNDLIRMLAKYHVKIKLPDTNIQKVQRFNDKFIPYLDHEIFCVVIKKEGYCKRCIDLSSVRVYLSYLSKVWIIARRDMRSIVKGYDPTSAALSRTF